MTAASLTAVRLEMMLPQEISAAVAARPVVYLPLGTIEWHGEHLPVGLDALTAHGVCMAAAQADGGIVYPPLFYGTGGDHAQYPWTVMATASHELEALLTLTLSRLQAFGIRLAVLFSGHFAPAQLEMIERIASGWPSDRGLRVIALAVNSPPLSLPPDHAGMFETTLLHALHPKSVQIDRLPSSENALVQETLEESYGHKRHDNMHPLYGVIGPDPRAFEPRASGALLEAMVDHVVVTIREALPEPRSQ